MYPYLFQDTPFEIATWDFMMVLGYVAIVAFGLIVKPKDFPASRRELFVLSLLLFFTGILGAKALHIFLYKDKYLPSSDPAAVMFYKAGAAFLGGLALQILAVLAFTKLRPKRISFLKIADFGMPLLLLHQAFVRVGCVAAGCCRGRPTSLPWGFYFKGQTVARHPTQIYELVYIIAIFLFIRRLYKKGVPDGVPLFGTLFLYAFFRFFNEFLRTDSPAVFGVITLSQAALFAIALFSGIALAKAARTKRQES
jgi:phosphatidylglycerol:prolipoprotein diacylglycerol transferase